MSFETLTSDHDLAFTVLFSAIREEHVDVSDHPTCFHLRRVQDGMSRPWKVGRSSEDDKGEFCFSSARLVTSVRAGFYCRCPSAISLVTALS